MRTIRCAFVDFWEEFTPKDIPYLWDCFHVIIDREKPDYLFYSCFGHEHYKYDTSIKIFWCGENLEPNFNDCDYAITYSEIEYGDRCFRDYCNFHQEPPLPQLSPEELLNRKFCNFIYSNNTNANPMRIDIFKKLSEYKKIDSAGSLLNNIGHCIPKGYQCKIEFQNQYKFSLAIENSSMIGYTTEKIYHPFLARSLPIYWGNPLIASDYNPISFINLMDYSSVEDMVEEIIRLDNDDNAYLTKVTAPFYLKGNNFEDFRRIEKERITSFYDSIFSQPLTKAGRRVMNGRAKAYRMGQEELQHPIKLLIRNTKMKIKAIISPKTGQDL